MKTLLRFLLATCLAVPTISISFADATFTLLQFSHDFGNRSVNRLKLGLSSRYVDDEHGPGLWIPVYSTKHTEMSLWPMNASERGASLCERSPGSCLAFGLILGAGIVYFASEVADQGDDEVTIGFSSGSTSIGVTSSGKSK